ncbi:MAG: 50S ribosomal protein L15 [Deltaproteobacteria bacterium]|nr:50S ribosomal protein L15 [Deltaproteobacteria bacterium]
MADELSRLQPAPGSQTTRKRIGRGQGSGWGKTAGRGQKGQRSRSSVHIRPGFEGGQMPLTRRLPKRGFTNVFAKDFTIINVGDLEGRFEAGAEVDMFALKRAGVISRIGRDGVKVLGRGELTIALTVKAARFSAAAKARIEAAGGKAEAV